MAAKGTTVAIDPRTGLIDRLVVPGVARSLVKRGAMQPALFEDLDHSWTCGDPKQLDGPGVWSTAPAWAGPDELFRLATADEAAALSPPAEDKWSKRRQTTAAKPVRFIEDGPIRSTVEAVFVCGPSTLVRQYTFDRTSGELDIHDRLFVNHRDRMLKLLVPLSFAPVRSESESLYSVVSRPPTERFEERVNQRWVAVGGRGGRWFGVVNTGSFAHNLTADTLALTVLRMPAYSSFNLKPDRPNHVGRFKPRHDQGEHTVSYRLLGGGRLNAGRLLDAADALNAPPIGFTWFPDGRDRGGGRAWPGAGAAVTCDPASVRIVAIKKAERGAGLIVRLQETAGRPAKATLRLGRAGAVRMELAGYELCTLRISKRRGRLLTGRTNLVEGM
jgi:alpha-mannosidase